MSEDPDVTTRSDMLDARMDLAGSPELMVRSLAMGLKRLNIYILLTGFGVIVDIFLSCILSLVIVAVNHSNHDQQLIAWGQCTVTAANAVKINSTDTSYVEYLKALPPAATPQLQANRVGTERIYENAVLDVPVCGPRP